MTLTPEQQEQMLEVAKPLIKWMNENCHPLCSVFVDQLGVELVESITSAYTAEFLKN